MTMVSEKCPKCMVLVDIEDLRRFKLALERARDYHPVVRKLWLQVAGLIQRAEQAKPAKDDPK